MPCREQDGKLSTVPPITIASRLLWGVVPEGEGGEVGLKHAHRSFECQQGRPKVRLICRRGRFGRPDN